MNSPEKQPAGLNVTRPTPEHLVVALDGSWQIGTHPEGAGEQVLQALATAATRQVSFDTTGLAAWDTTILAFIMKVAVSCTPGDITVDYTGLPEGVRGLLKLATAVPERKGAARGGAEKQSLVVRAGLWGLKVADDTRDVVSFIGESLVAVANMFRGKAIYRKVDVVDALQQCGSEALPIVALISVLVGMILAFLGAVQLQMFGAQIYVADLVGVGMVREMGALMTGIIMAGRTGASFAARLGSMQVNEEVDALTTMGFSPMEFLVLPRMVAMVVMMPLLCIYANFLGIVGGAIVGVGMLDLTPTQYYLQTVNAISLQAVASGLIKSVVFGAVVAISGCMHGIRCGRSASAVGDATTKAVVSGIVAIIVWDCAITVVYTIIGF
jgi:phospholipid/cholesterol/gamma-HCH transport system permease protein